MKKKSGYKLEYILVCEYSSLPDLMAWLLRDLQKNCKIKDRAVLDQKCANVHMQVDRMYEVLCITLTSSRDHPP